MEGSPFADWSDWDRHLSPEGSVTDHHLRFHHDIRLLKQMGVNAYRLSLEWSRIEPEDGRTDEAALDRYCQMVESLLEYGIEPMVTLHHFTNPLWFSESTPWHDERSVERFVRFVERAVPRLAAVRYWITFNEPYVLILGGYFDGCMPPGVRNPLLGLRAARNLYLAHGEAYDIIHNCNPDAMVSVAHNMAVFAPWHRWNPLDHILVKLSIYLYNHSLLDAFGRGDPFFALPFLRGRHPLPIRGKLDFMGVNYYMRLHLGFNPFKKAVVDLRHRDLEGYGLSDMGWETHPRGLEKVLKSAAQLDLPIIITENGIATSESEKRNRFLKNHIDAVERCIGRNIPVRGYFHWTLMDNYEWLSGMGKRFGLYRVDFDTKERIPTSSAEYFAHLIRSRRY